MTGQFDLTSRAFTANAVQTQQVWQAVDISAFDNLTVSIQPLLINATTCTLQLLGGMQNQTTSGYVPLLTAGLTLVTATPQIVYINRQTGPMFRYLLWSVTALAGSSPTACFFIRCTGRSWAA